LPRIKHEDSYYPTVFPNWDDTPRYGKNGHVVNNTKPELFLKKIIKAIEFINKRPTDKRLIFIKSWNEWAEGNYLEPDKQYDRIYLNIIKNIMFYNYIK
jgi:hypothetical protein